MKLANWTLACIGILLAACGNVLAGPITVTSQLAQSYAGTYVPFDFASGSYTGTALDGVDHTATAVHAVGSYTTTVNLSEQPLAATLSYSFSGSTTGLTASALSLAVVEFTAAGSNLSYALSGDYSYSYPGPYGGFKTDVFADFYAHLKDLTTNTFLFRNEQASTYTTAPFTFTLGGTAGTLPSTLEGSLNGLLISGHDYELTYTADSRYDTVDTSGNVGLEITAAPAEVPEPASLALFGLGALGLMVRSRRGRRTRVPSDDAPAPAPHRELGAPPPP